MNRTLFSIVTSIIVTLNTASIIFLIAAQEIHWALLVFLGSTLVMVSIWKGVKIQTED